MPPKAAACPICGQPATPTARPFCSSACRDRDLLKWLGEGYSIPGPPAQEEAEKNRIYGVDSDED